MGLSLPSSKSYLANLILRFLQLIFAVTVIGLYAQDLDAARKAGKYADSKWVRPIPSLLPPSYIHLSCIPLLSSLQAPPSRLSD